MIKTRTGSSRYENKLLGKLKDRIKLFLSSPSAQKLFLWASALLFSYFFILRFGQYQYDFPANDFFAAFSHDARFVFYLLLYIILGMVLLRFFRIKELGKGFVIALLLLSFFISVFQNFLYSFHRFSSTKLGFQLFQEYIGEALFFLPSIGGGDFNILNFIGGVLLWNLLSFFFTLYPFREKAKKWILRAGLALFCISILYDQTKQGLYPRALRDKNHILHFWSTKSKVFSDDTAPLDPMMLAPDLGGSRSSRQGLSAADKKAAASRDSQITSFDKCLLKKYEYPQKGYNFYRVKKARPESQAKAIVSVPREKPNILLVMMESFSSLLIDGSENITPYFNKLKKKGLYFSNFYANGISTVRGQYAALCSVYPHFGNIISKYFPNLKLRCIPHVFKDHAYHTAYLSATELTFENTRHSFRNIGFETIIGPQEMPPEYGDYAWAWGISDEKLFAYASHFLDKKRSQPLFLKVMTISNHHPYNLPKSSTFTAKYPSDSMLNRIKNTMMYSDQMMGKFIENLEKKGQLKNTIVIITADTSLPFKQHHDNFMLFSYAYEENFKIPFLIYAPDYIHQFKEYKTLASQVDILPTLLDLFDIQEPKNAFVGQNMLASDACSYALLLQPYGERYIAMRHKNYKYIYNLEEKTASIYDLKEDPGEHSPKIYKDISKLPSPLLDMHRFGVREVYHLNRTVHLNTFYP